MKKKLLFMGSVIGLASLQASAVGLPTTVIDCRPCVSLKAFITSKHAGTVSTINANVTAQMQSAATLIVTAITQSTAQISASIDKQTAVLKVIADATITSRYEQSNRERAVELAYVHTALPGSCQAPTAGLGLRASTARVIETQQELSVRNDGWNRIAQSPDWTSAQSAVTLKQNVEAVAQAYGDSTTPTMSSLLATDSLSDTDTQIAQLYSHQLTNPSPAPQVLADGDGDNAEAWVRRENKQRAIEIAQAAFEQATARRVPSADLQAWFEAVSGQQADGPVSYNQVMEAEAKRRFFDPNWVAQMQTASAENIMRENAMINAQKLYLMWEIFKELERVKMLQATTLSQEIINE